MREGLTSPTLPPEAEALVQEALYKLGPRNDRAEVYQLSILRDLARRLLEPGEKEVCSLCALRLHRAEVCADGSLRMSLMEPTGAAQILAETFAGMLDTSQAENYLEITFLRPTDQQRYTVTVFRPEGKTPHELRRAAEQSLSSLRADGWLELAVREVFRLDDYAVEKLMRTVEAYVGREPIEAERRAKALRALSILRKHRDMEGGNR